MIEAKGWKRIPGLRARLTKAAAATSARLPKKFRFSFSANVLLTGNACVKQLNHDFRGIDKPTNVLSFPQFMLPDLPKLGKEKKPVALGDIAIAYMYTAKEAKENNKLLENHTVHLLIHGLLHLFGYDHLSDLDARKMEKLETEIMKDLELPNPYAPQQQART
ncbi:MAG: rRNA maturation RNase YbeY [Hyphomicrobiales bacterium]|nr:rRNA maturation RNase YbeY [Hyphomicrobiales bacterium]